MEIRGCCSAAVPIHEPPLVLTQGISSKAARVDETLNPAKLSTWLSLESVFVNFLGNHRTLKYMKMVDEPMENFR